MSKREFLKCFVTELWWRHQEDIIGAAICVLMVVVGLAAYSAFLLFVLWIAHLIGEGLFVAILLGSAVFAGAGYLVVRCGKAIARVWRYCKKEDDYGC